MHAYNLAWQLGSVRGASGSAVRGATNIEQARYLYGRAAKGMSLWRGWDAYNSYLRSSVRSAGGAARLAVDPVAALTSPFTGEELLLVVKASAALKLGGAADGASNPATRAEPPSDDGRRLSRGGERLVVGFVSSYFRDHNLLRLTRSLFTMADKSMVSHELFAESDDDGTHILRQTQRAADSFTRVRSMATPDAVREMASKRLHIAINLNGHHWNSASESVRALHAPSRTPAHTLIST